ncbi:MAG: carbon-nitrogen hydrolase family protein [Thermoleophilia bacterium]
MDGSAERSRVAVVQMATCGVVDDNLEAAERLVGAAVERGAHLVVLPERWNLIHDTRRTLEGAEALDGPSLAAVRGWARRWDVAILAGSIAERTPEGARTFNTSVLVGRDGADVAVYRKTHLFDVAVDGHTYRESDCTAPGAELAVGDAAGLRLGLTVCYDLRFPELYRALVDRGATALAVPAAFTAATGRDHWEPLLRARAIENQCFVVAADQFGTHADGTRSHGRSMIVDPWGVVLATVPDGEGVAVADLDLAHQRRIRASLPALRHRRPELY